MRILGIDEVGRGCIAGPLVVGAVVLDNPISGLKDSKLLTRTRREYFSEIINKQALFSSLGWASQAEIDALGLSRCLALAAERALIGFSLSVDKIILDGNYNYLPKHLDSETLINGDNLIPSISAASVVAKVARDNYMIQLASAVSNYGFESNVGYCTKAHREALIEHGCCEHHRKSFEPVRSILSGNTSASAPGRVRATLPAS